VFIIRGEERRERRERKEDERDTLCLKPKASDIKFIFVLLSLHP
jgi:hypothetical protein